MNCAARRGESALETPHAWRELTCQEYEDVWCQADDEAHVASSITDPDGVYGSPLTFTLWLMSDGSYLSTALEGRRDTEDYKCSHAASVPVLETPAPSDEDENVLRKVAWAIRGATYTERATSGEPVGEGLAADEARSPRSWEELPDEARKMWLGDAMSALKACDYFELRRNRDRWEAIAKSRAPVEPVPLYDVLQKEFEDAWKAIRLYEDGALPETLAWWQGFASGVEKAQSLSAVEPVPPRETK